MSETKHYAFEAGVIRLNQRDFDRWEKAFPHVALRAELWSLHEWAGRQKNWFTATAAALAKRERESTRPVSRRRFEMDPLGNRIEAGDDE